jgi:hypothetical protein
MRLFLSFVSIKKSFILLPNHFIPILHRSSHTKTFKSISFSLYIVQALQKTSLIHQRNKVSLGVCLPMPIPNKKHYRRSIHKATRSNRIEVTAIEDCN